MQHQKVLILDFGGQYNQLIARRVRENNVYSEVVPYDISIEEIKENEVPLLDVATSIDDKYIKDTDIKIEIHKKINTIDSYESLEKIKYEIEDRFGKISENMLIYMYEELFEKMAKQIEIKKVEQTKNFIKLIFNEDFTNKIKVDDIFVDVSKISRMFRFSMHGKSLVIILDTVYLDKHFVYYLVDLMDLIIKKYKQKNQN